MSSFVTFGCCCCCILELLLLRLVLRNWAAVIMLHGGGGMGGNGRDSTHSWTVTGDLDLGCTGSVPEDVAASSSSTLSSSSLMVTTLISGTGTGCVVGLSPFDERRSIVVSKSQAFYFDTTLCSY